MKAILVKTVKSASLRFFFDIQQQQSRASRPQRRGAGLLLYPEGRAKQKRAVPLLWEKKRNEARRDRRFYGKSLQTGPPIGT